MNNVIRLPSLLNPGLTSFVRLCQTPLTISDFNSSTERALTSLSNGISGAHNPYEDYVAEASFPNASTSPIYK